MHVDSTMGPMRTRRCCACGELREWESFPRYESPRRGKRQGGLPYVRFGPRCFGCGAQPVRSKLELDAAFGALVPIPGVCVPDWVIAELTGCSLRTVRQIEQMALRKMRERAPWLAAMLGSI